MDIKKIKEICLKYEKLNKVELKNILLDKFDLLNDSRQSSIFGSNIIEEYENDNLTEEFNYESFEHKILNFDNDCQNKKSGLSEYLYLFRLYDFNKKNKNVIERKNYDLNVMNELLKINVSYEYVLNLAAKNRNDKLLHFLLEKKDMYNFDILKENKNRKYITPFLKNGKNFKILLKYISQDELKLLQDNSSELYDKISLSNKEIKLTDEEIVYNILSKEHYYASNLLKIKKKISKYNFDAEMKLAKNISIKELLLFNLNNVNVFKDSSNYKSYTDFYNIICPIEEKELYKIQVLPELATFIPILKDLAIKFDIVNDKDYESKIFHENSKEDIDKYIRYISHNINQYYDKQTNSFVFGFFIKNYPKLDNKTEIEKYMSNYLIKNNSELFPESEIDKMLYNIDYNKCNIANLVNYHYIYEKALYKYDNNNGFSILQDVMRNYFTNKEEDELINNVKNILKVFLEGSFQKSYASTNKINDKPQNLNDLLTYILNNNQLNKEQFLNNILENYVNFKYKNRKVTEMFYVIKNFQLNKNEKSMYSLLNVVNNEIKFNRNNEIDFNDKKIIDFLAEYLSELDINNININRKEFLESVNKFISRFNKNIMKEHLSYIENILLLSNLNSANLKNINKIKKL